MVVLTIFPNFAFTKIRGDMKKYTKPALDFQAQIELLKSRGLRIDDEKRAIRHLSNVSYYRLSAYMLPFKELDAQGEPPTPSSQEHLGMTYIIFISSTGSSDCWFSMLLRELRLHSGLR